MVKISLRTIYYNMSRMNTIHVEVRDQTQSNISGYMFTLVRG